MKKIIPRLLVILLLSFSIFSCEKDPVPSASAPSIIGKWTPIKTEIRVPNAPTIVEPYDENVVGCNKNYTEFLENGIANDVVYSKINNACVPSTDAAVWVLTGSNLKIQDGAQVSNLTIETLTGTELIVKGTEVFSGITTTFILTLSRI